LGKAVGNRDNFEIDKKEGKEEVGRKYFGEGGKEKKGGCSH